MKIVCDCGNEMDFIIENEDVQEEQDEDECEEEKGQYCIKESGKFDLWSEHDEAGITCNKCKKTIWYFT